MKFGKSLKNLPPQTQKFIPRRLITRIRLKRSQYYEYNSAVKIQKIIRGKIGRSRHLRLFLDFAITRIQSMWRGTYVTCFLKLHIDYFLRC